MTKVQETDNSGFSDPEHFIEKEVGTFHSLKSLAQDDEIITVVREIGESGVEICLYDGNSSSGAFDHLVLFLFNAHDFGLFELSQKLQQSSGTATEVENTRFSGDHGSDCFKILAGENGIMIESDFGHSLSGSKLERKLETSRPRVLSSRRNAS